MVDCVSVEKEYGRGFFLPRGILTFAFRIIYCYTYRLFYAGRGMAVPRKPFSGANWLQPQDLDNLHR